VDEYLHKELLEGRIADITDKAGLLPIQISPLGAIPKKHTPGKWRLIVDLSSPKDFSIKDGIPKEFFSLSYVSWSIHVFLQISMPFLLSYYGQSVVYQNAKTQYTV